MSFFRVKGNETGPRSRGSEDPRRSWTSQSQPGSSASYPLPPPNVLPQQAIFHAGFWGANANQTPSSSQVPPWPTPEPYDFEQPPAWRDTRPSRGSAVDYASPQASPRYDQTPQSPQQRRRARQYGVGQEQPDWGSRIQSIFSRLRVDTLEFSEISNYLGNFFPGYDPQRDHNLVMQALRKHFIQVREDSNKWRLRPKGAPSVSGKRISGRP